MAKKTKKFTAPPIATTIHEANVATDGSGAVFKGKQIDGVVAVALREAGKDVVVCGSSLAVNRAQAREIEREASLAFVFHNAHSSSGPEALPHFQPVERPPAGHTFYEGSTKRFKAKKRP